MIGLISAALAEAAAQERQLRSADRGDRWFLSETRRRTRRPWLRPGPWWQPPAPAVASSVTVRYAIPPDGPALLRLAALDSRPLPGGRLLVAEVAGELWAAVQVGGRCAIADPFRPTADLVSLLRRRARQLGGRSPLRARVPSLGRRRWAPRSAAEPASLAVDVRGHGAPHH